MITLHILNSWFSSKAMVTPLLLGQCVNINIGLRSSAATFQMGSDEVAND